MKVRCIYKNSSYLEYNKVYDVLGEAGNMYIVQDKNNDRACFYKRKFQEVKEMNELTFKDVIENIKDGESYRAIYEKGLGNRPTITRNQNSIEIDFPLKTDCYLFTGDMLFELVRKAYTFEEAFRAYEEGKEIECCYGGQKLKKENEKDYYFNYDKEEYVPLSFDEAFFDIATIRSEWYIND